MTTKTKKPDAFGSVLGALRAVYEAEIVRLADLYRPRILVGEFSGNTGIDRWTKRTGPEQGDPRYLRLEDEIQRTHAWLATPAGARAVLACSFWPESGACTRDHTEGWSDAEIAAESMGRDVLAEAARRGWVKRHTDARPYALRVA